MLGRLLTKLRRRRLPRWYLVRNDRRIPDRETQIIHPYYSQRGIPRPFTNGTASTLGTIEPISEDLAQTLLILIAQGHRIEGVYAPEG